MEDSTRVYNQHYQLLNPQHHMDLKNVLDQRYYHTSYIQHRLNPGIIISYTIGIANYIIIVDMNIIRWKTSILCII